MSFLERRTTRARTSFMPSSLSLSDYPLQLLRGRAHRAHASVKRVWHLEPFENACCHTGDRYAGNQLAVGIRSLAEMQCRTAVKSRRVLYRDALACLIRGACGVPCTGNYVRARCTHYRLTHLEFETFRRDAVDDDDDDAPPAGDPPRASRRSSRRRFRDVHVGLFSIFLRAV